MCFFSPTFLSITSPSVGRYICGYADVYYTFTRLSITSIKTWVKHGPVTNNRYNIFITHSKLSMYVVIDALLRVNFIPFMQFSSASIYALNPIVDGCWLSVFCCVSISIFFCVVVSASFYPRLFNKLWCVMGFFVVQKSVNLITIKRVLIDNAHVLV